VIAVYKLPRTGRSAAASAWSAATRPRCTATASITTPDGGYLNARGTEGRLPTFHQLDLRVDKTFTYKRVLVNVYLDVINVYNRQNGEAIVYSYNLQHNTVQAGLPIIPRSGRAWSSRR
jgi:hypothetical protein